MDPFQKFQPRRAPGANTIADLLVPTKPAPATKSNAITPKEALQLAGFTQRLIEAGTKAVAKEGEQYLFPFPPGQGPPGAGAPQKKVIEDLGGLLAPKAIFKALTEIGEGNIPLVKRVTGVGLGLGVGEEDEIFKLTERHRVEREAFFSGIQRREALRLRAAALASPFQAGVPSASIQPERIQPVSAAALANQAAAEGIRQVLVSERADP